MLRAVAVGTARGKNERLNPLIVYFPLGGRLVSDVEEKGQI